MQYETVAETLIKTIRDTGADNIIVIDGGTSGQDNDGDGTVTSDDSCILAHGNSILNYEKTTAFDNGSIGNGNVIFSVHMYGTWNGSQSRFADYIDAVHAQGLAIIIGEFGGGYVNALKNAIRVSADKGIGWIVWHWDGGGDPDLTAGIDGGGWAIDRTDGSKPTNLTLFGDKVWDYSHGTVPNFQIRDISITEVIPGKTQFIAGDGISFSASILNPGDVDVSGSVKVNFMVGSDIIGTGTYTGTIKSNGRAAVASGAYTATASNITVKAVIDTAGSDYGIDENSSNNEASLTIDGSASSVSGFDLVPVEIKISKNGIELGSEDTIYYGDTINISVTVLNSPQLFQITVEFNFKNREKNREDKCQNSIKAS